MTKQIFVHLKLAPHRLHVCPSWIWYPERLPISVTGDVKPFLQCRCRCLLVVFSAVNVFVLTFLLPTTCLSSDLKKGRKVNSASEKVEKVVVKSVYVFTTLSARNCSFCPHIFQDFPPANCHICHGPGRGEGHRRARQTYDRQQVGWGHLQWGQWTIGGFHNWGYRNSWMMLDGS